MRFLKYVVVIGWTLLLVTVALAFVLPRQVSYVFRPVSSIFPLIPASLLLLTSIYRAIVFYLVGIGRNTGRTINPTK
jgi:hypothetical protein